MDGRVSQLFLSPQVITAKDAGKAEPPKDAAIIRAYLVASYDAGSSYDRPYLSTIREASPSCGSGSFTAYAISARFCTASHCQDRWTCLAGPDDVHRVVCL